MSAMGTGQDSSLPWAASAKPHSLDSVRLRHSIRICWLDKLMNAWTPSLVLDLEKGLEAGSERGCSRSIHSGLGRPGWTVRDKNGRRDWDLNLEELGIPNSEACELRKVWAQGNNVRKAALNSRGQRTVEAEGPAWRAL